MPAFLETTARIPIVSATLHLPRGENGRALVAHCPFCETDHHHGAADLDLGAHGKITSRGPHCLAEPASAFIGTDMPLRIDRATTAAAEGDERAAHPIITKLGWKLWQRLGTPDRAAIRAEGRKSNPRGPGDIDGWNGSSLRRKVVAAIFPCAGGWSSERIHLFLRINLDGWSKWSLEQWEPRRFIGEDLGQGDNLLSLLAALSGWSICELAREILQNVDGALTTVDLDRIAAIVGGWIERGHVRRRVDHIEPEPAREWLADQIAFRPPGFGNSPGIKNPTHEIAVDSVCQSIGHRLGRKAVQLAVPGGGAGATSMGASSIWCGRWGEASMIVTDGTEVHPHGLVAVLATLYALPRGLVVLRLLEASTGVRLDTTAAFELMEVR